MSQKYLARAAFLSYFAVFEHEDFGREFVDLRDVVTNQNRRHIKLGVHLGKVVLQLFAHGVIKRGERLVEE